jgi:hypothetical protein
MGLSGLSDDLVKINVASVIAGQSCVEISGRLSACLSYLVGLQGSLDNVSNSAVLSPRQTVGEITGFRTTNGKLRFGHSIDIA